MKNLFANLRRVLVAIGRVIYRIFHSIGILAWLICWPFVLITRFLLIPKALIFDSSKIKASAA